MSWGIVAVAGASLVGNVISSKSQKSAASDASYVQQQSASEANALQRYMYDKNRADTAPFRDIELQGANIGLNAMNELYDKSVAGPGDFNFDASEGYKWKLGEGLKALDSSAIASGRSRNADTINYAEGLASTEYDNARNRWQSEYYNSLNPLQSLAKVQTGYNNAMGTAGQNYANSAGVNSRYAGDAAAQAALAGGQANAQMWNTIGNMPMNALSAYNMYQQPTQQNPYQWQPGPTGPTSPNAMMNYGGR